MDDMLNKVSCVFDDIIKRFTNVEELTNWARIYNLLEDRVVKERINQLNSSFKCEQCFKEFKYKQNLVRHCKTVHAGPADAFRCSICGKIFKRRDVMQRHLHACSIKSKLDESSRQYTCECGKIYKYKHHLIRHKEECTASLNCSVCGESIQLRLLKEHEEQCKLKRKEKNFKKKKVYTKQNDEKKEEPATSLPVRCRKCHEMLPNRKELYRHQMTDHMSGSGSYPWAEGEEPWIDSAGKVDESLKKTYDTNFSLIREFTEGKELSASYNFPIPHDFHVSDIVDLTHNVYNRQKHAFRLNIIFGYILRNNETGEFRYFKPFENEEVFDFPIYISKRKDIEKFTTKLNDIDLCNYILRQRPNTKWRIHLVTNVKFLVYYSKFALGTTKTLPSYITKKNNAIISFEKDPKHSTFYNDNFCLFRRLVYHKLKSHTVGGFEKEVKRYFKTWCQFLMDNEHIRNSECYAREFDGVHIDEIGYFEMCFNINIDIYEMDENENARVIYKSLCAYENHMFLNIYDNHLSYIINIKRYCKKYICQLCDKHFISAKKVNRHFKECSNKTKHIYPGGFYSIKKTIFQELKEIDIIVPEKDQIFPWFITFDTEAMLEKSSRQSAPKLTFESCHVPISVSICSNIPGYDKEKFILNENLDILLREMIDYMHLISSAVFELSSQRWSSAFKKLEKIKRIWQPNVHDDKKDESDDDIKIWRQMNLNLRQKNLLEK